MKQSNHNTAACETLPFTADDSCILRKGLFATSYLNGKGIVPASPAVFHELKELQSHLVESPVDAGACQHITFNSWRVFRWSCQDPSGITEERAIAPLFV
ncbi:hypothetical protein EGT74_14035 [Chitinophaga lutea]|uniref:Uncharacterized protein n=1 Tax=Chitinophaga lutea TaxID=2488634 RepID=A0A3N4PHK0_9BACT|nr:hypothetical protein EGT74_14035 [Chitinophaga lutea]